jgi:hypoxanthine phosphoribosyltransferase
MIPAEQIDRAVAQVAEQINADYADREVPLFLGVLNGSFMFMSDLMKKVEFSCELSFVKLASYVGTSTTGKVQELIGLKNNIEGRHVIVVEDIVDTGESIEHLMRSLSGHNPASVDTYGAEADLVLSGHTHKGQLFPGSLITDAMYTVDHGYYRRDGESPHVIVSSGFGTWGPPIRVGTESEIVVVDVKI